MKYLPILAIILLVSFLGTFLFARVLLGSIYGWIAMIAVGAVVMIYGFLKQGRRMDEKESQAKELENKEKS